MNRPSQLNLDSLAVSEGLFAPAIRHHKGTFYVICTLVGRKGNFYVTAEDPKGPWSDPVWLSEINGIDPSIFFDDNGKTYIVHNAPPPDGKSLYQGHRSIRLREYSLDSNAFVGQSKLLVNGGVDITAEPVWIEAPHIFKKDDFYYLIAAEGGTGYNHSEVVFRSRSVKGPYEPYHNNPILTQRHLDPDRPNPITSTGHADMVKLPNGNWWSVFLGCRPYEDDMYNTGRETFLMPVAWKNGWPIITEGKKKVPYFHSHPEIEDKTKSQIPLSGNFTVKDDFSETSLPHHWNFLRTVREKWYELETEKLYIKPRPQTIYSRTNPSFIGRRQQHQSFKASVSLSYQLFDTSETIGMIAFQNEKHYLLAGKRKNRDNKTVVYLERASGKVQDGRPLTIAKQPLEMNGSDLFLKIEGSGRYYSFFYKTNKEDEWIPIREKVDAGLLSTKVAGGFVGTYLGMYASTKHFLK